VEKSICEFELPSLLPRQELEVLKVQQRDISSLRPRTWLNDVVISYYIRRYFPVCRWVYNFDCQFFAFVRLNQALSGFDYDSFLKYCNVTNKLNWEDYKYVQVPVCFDFHWSFVVIENAYEEIGLTTFFHVDSIRGFHNTRALSSVLINYISCEKKLKKGIAHSMKYKQVSVSTDPQQRNSFDCGIFVLHYMEKINQQLLEDPTLTLSKRIRELCMGLKPRRCNTLRSSVVKLLVES